MQKSSIISSIITIVLISILFGFLFKSLNREMSGEKNSAERFLNLSVALAVNSIQDDISFTYRELSDLCKETGEEGKVSEEEILAVIEGYDLSGKYAEQMLQERVLIDYEVEIRDYFNFFNDSNSDYSFRIYLEQKKAAGFREMVFIDNFNGFMVFPLSRELEGESINLLFYKLDIEEVVHQHLPALVETFQANSPEMKTGDFSGFISQVLTGEELKQKELSHRGDVIIDLNRMFNMNTIFDYQKSRVEREYIHFEDIANIIDNHLYLTIGHESGSIEQYFKNKIGNYTLGLSILYLFTISAVFSLLYTTFRVKRSVMREKEFTAMVSHELKTPLSVIKLGADNLAGGFVEDSRDVAEYGQMIRKESDRLGEMIGKILSITGTLDSNSLSRFAPAAIDDIIRDLEKQSRSLLIGNRVELEIISRNSKEMLFCNKITLTGALFNILQNSIIYGAANAEDKKVILSICDENRKRREGILVEVRDTGPGISWKEAKKIFIPFYRGSIGKERHISGTGLGLSISRKIIRQHRGQIQLNRSLRKETVFQVWIPYRMRNEKNIDD